MMYLFRKTVFDCSQATLLSLKRDQGQITFMERLKLSYHLLYCDPCRTFIRQSTQIDRAGDDLKNLLASRPPFVLPATVRERIQEELDKVF